MSAPTITGRLASGVGEGRHFTRLDWARERFVAGLGIDPFPGTLNLILDDPAERAKWRALRTGPGVRVDPPDPGGCGARCYPMRLAGIALAAVVPEVPGYPDDRIELIAAVGLRAALGLADGAAVTLEVAPG